MGLTAPSFYYWFVLVHSMLFTVSAKSPNYSNTSTQAIFSLKFTTNFVRSDPHWIATTISKYDSNSFIFDFANCLLGPWSCSSVDSLQDSIHLDSYSRVSDHAVQLDWRCLLCWQDSIVQISYTLFCNRPRKLYRWQLYSEACRYRHHATFLSRYLCCLLCWWAGMAFWCGCRCCACSSSYFADRAGR